MKTFFFSFLCLWKLNGETKYHLLDHHLYFQLVFCPIYPSVLFYSPLRFCIMKSYTWLQMSRAHSTKLSFEVSRECWVLLSGQSAIDVMCVQRLLRCPVFITSPHLSFLHFDLQQESLEIFLLSYRRKKVFSRERNVKQCLRW